MSIYAMVFWLVALAALFTPDVVALSLFICTAAFGALNVLPDGAAGGGINLLPQSAAAAILINRMAITVRGRQTMLASAFNWRGYAIFLGFVVYACITAAVLPAIFKDKIYVIALDSPQLVKLEPTIANLNQSLYLVLNVISAIALFAYLKQEPVSNRRQTLLQALIVSGLIFILSGLLDFSGAAPDLVTSFKTASYKIILEAEVASVRRITGFFSEAASYGSPCVQLGALLFFCRSAFNSGVMRDWICPIVACALVGMAAMSTSSTALIGVFMFAILLVGRTIYRLTQGSLIEDIRVELVIIAFVAGLFALVATVDSQLLETPATVVESIIVRKATGYAYLERAHWNERASDVTKQSYGMGVGAGSQRTSDWVYSLLSNTGFIGFGLMAGFIGLLFAAPPSRSPGRSIAMAEGAKYALAIFMTTEIVSGTTIDPGLTLAILAAMIGAGSRWSDSLTPNKRRAPNKRRSKRRRHRAEDTSPSATPAFQGRLGAEA